MYQVHCIMHLHYIILISIDYLTSSTLFTISYTLIGLSELFHEIGKSPALAQFAQNYCHTKTIIVFNTVCIIYIVHIHFVLCI